MLLINQIKKENTGKVYKDITGNLYEIIDFYGAICVVNPQSKDRDFIILSEFILHIQVEEVKVLNQETNTTDIIMDKLTRNNVNHNLASYYNENGYDENGFDRDGYRKDGSYIL